MAQRKVKLPRPNLFDNLLPDPSANLFCDRAHLTNEASVETFFVSRLLQELGYKDGQIQTKKAISELAVPKGGKKVKYKPDYVLSYRKRPRIVIDAKHPDANLDDWKEQCSGYCLLLNQKFKNEDPVSLFVLTNGILTRVFKWNEEEVVLELKFEDFDIGNPSYEQLHSILAASQIGDTKSLRDVESRAFTMRRPSAEEAKRIFAQCHKIIWKGEGYSPTAAFMEFVKLMFVKLWMDRELRENPKIEALLDASDVVKLPKSAVTFSVDWIEREKHADNPVSDILFKTLRDRIEVDIEDRKKKRIFEKTEYIEMRPDTIKQVVKKLEHLDMFGIDEDLNGRLFETFLSATMRGRDLGQYFTPRSIVKLMTKMAQLEATPKHQDRAIDACCGTGGFLIEILTEMRDKVRSNKSLSFTQQEELIEKIANESIFGIDFGKSPPIAKIARVNMYLHGDGGSRIYHADGLDKDLVPFADQDPEVLANQKELRRDLAAGLRFNVALTNPPFSMTKDLVNDTEAKILKAYDLGLDSETIKPRPSLRSSAMFMERYRDLLLPGGRLLTVIDETLLSSDNFAYVRDFIRGNFYIRAIVSLPGDAFRRSGARVKTSVLCLEKKGRPNAEQANVFYAFAENIGVDDLPSKASEHDIAEARKRAEAEIKKISDDFTDFLSGKNVSSTVKPDRIANRFDLKYVVPMQGRLVNKWRKAGIGVERIGDVVQLDGMAIVPQSFPEKTFGLISVSYDGICRIEKKIKGKRITPTVMYQVSKGDLVFSNIRATDGAIGIVPESMDGALVSVSSYTVLRCPTYEDTVYLWSMLRSHEVRADMMSISTGTSRYTTDWESVADIEIPWVSEVQRKHIAAGFIEAWELEKKMAEARQKSLDSIEDLGVESKESLKRYHSYQAPK